MNTSYSISLKHHVKFVCVAMLLGSYNPLAQAAEFYKYKDANGHWVFTDKKPKQQEVQSERLLVTEAHAKATVVNRGSRERPMLYAVNQMAGPVQVWLEFSNTRNMRVSAPEPYLWLVEPLSETFLATLEKRDAQLSWSYQWQGEMTPGQPLDANQFSAPALSLPFVGGPFVVSQAFHGEVSHNSNEQAFYAIDITMPKGTPVVAVRDGVVMDVERDFSRSGWSQTYADEANFVRLLHEDGSMTIYAHLDSDSIHVGIGQKVAKGDVLGLSGTTGFSTGPHLHFAVQINAGKALKSIPFVFAREGEPKVRMFLANKTLGGSKLPVGAPAN